MKRTLLSTLALSSLSLFGLNLYAEDLQTVYQLATQKDPVVQRAAANRDAAIDNTMAAVVAISI
ncbi:hypothetical protein [Alishewanella longhuensis]